MALKETFRLLRPYFASLYSLVKMYLYSGSKPRCRARTTINLRIYKRIKLNFPDGVSSGKIIGVAEGI